MARNDNFDDVNTISQAATKIAAIIALVIIISIDARSAAFDGKDIEFILAGFVAGAEALATYKKIKK